MKHASGKDPLFLILASSRRFPVVVAIIEKMQEFANKTERITISQWVDDKWYVDVVDDTMLAKAMSGTSDDRISSHRFALSVSVKADRVVFNHAGGNCYARGRRWQRFAKENLPTEMADNELVDLGKRSLENKHIHLYK